MSFFKTQWLFSLFVVMTITLIALSVVPELEAQQNNTFDRVQAEKLLSQNNCLNCHNAAKEISQNIASSPAPNLAVANEWLTANHIKNYLSQGHMVGKLSEEALDNLQHFLSQQGKGHDFTASRGEELSVKKGQHLYQSIGCVSCHDAKGIEGLNSKTSVKALSLLLLEPSKYLPHGRMPNFRLKKTEAKDLAVFLLKDQVKTEQSKNHKSKIHGLNYSYYAENFKNEKHYLKNVAIPKRKGVCQKIEHTNVCEPRRKVRYVYKFEGRIEIVKDGTYTFFSEADDGAYLYVNHKKVVDNGGKNNKTEAKGSVELKKGQYPFTVLYYQIVRGSGLKINWQGPDFEKQEIAEEFLIPHIGKPMLPIGLNTEFVVDDLKAKAGKEVFAKQGCVNCHQIKNINKTPFRFKGFENLNPHAEKSCLTNKTSFDLPQFKFSEKEKNLLVEALTKKNELKKKKNAQEKVMQTLVDMNCLACHKREEHRGPAKIKDLFFKSKGDVDLGEEGRLPPTLDRVGDKFKPTALDAIIHEGLLHVRPYMKTRMPSFNKKVMPELINNLVSADRNKDAEALKITKKVIADGQQLVGTVNGLGCINCHNVAGNKSLGIPAVDLATVAERINPDWFVRFLKNPEAFNKGTRMPPFWLNDMVVIKDVAGGLATAQQQSIYAYLSLGLAMPLPKGLVVDDKVRDLVPDEEPIVLRTFFKEASPRGIAVGYPERVHVVFDANVVKMRMAWKGKFFDPWGTWAGRGGRFNGPSGHDVIDMPDGPSFALLEDIAASWPTVKMKDRNIGGRFKGYRLNKKQQPIFMYELKGVKIEEQAIPKYFDKGVGILRRFKLTPKEDIKNLYFMLGSADDIEEKNSLSFVLNSKKQKKVLLQLRVLSQNSLEVIKRKADSKKQQLLVPLNLKNNELEFEVEMSW